MAPGGKKVYLDEDQIKVPGCAFVLLSFVSPVSNQKCESFGIKVRGTFATREEAEAHAERLSKVDPDFDVFVADCYRWLLCPPKADDVHDEVYSNSLLNQLVKTEKEERRKGREAFELRRREMKESPQPTAPPPEASKLLWSDIVEEESEMTPSELLETLERS